MNFDKRCEEALQHVDHASAFLLGGAPHAGEDRPPEENTSSERESARTAAFEHLAAARRELKGLREEMGQQEGPQEKKLQEKSGSGRPRAQSRDGGKTLRMASGILGLVTILIGQIGETRQALEPLRPSGNGKSPLQRFREADIDAILDALRHLRRPASAMEASLRRLRNRLREGGAPTD